MISKLLGIRGYLEAGVAAILLSLLAWQAMDARHWHKQSDRYNQLYTAEQSAHRQTVINYQNAANVARQQDAANKARVAAEQSAINKQRDASYEARLADARARAERLRSQLEATAHPGGPGAAPVPGLPGSPLGPDGSTADHGLSLDERLVATEQAIQLDELQKWVSGQSGVDVGNK